MVCLAPQGVTRIVSKNSIGLPELGAQPPAAEKF